jgi:vacuolar-type H+-ATPase subunit H
MSQQPTPPDRGDQGPVPDGQGSIDRSSFEGTGAKTSERIQLIIDAAEQAAAGIIDDAEAQARQYLEEARARADRIAAQRATKMWSFTDDLIERAEAVKQQSDELLRALDEARQGVEKALREEPGPEALGAERWQPREAVAPPAEPEPAADSNAEPQRQPQPQPEQERRVESAPPPPPPSQPPRHAADSPPSEGARLLATQMAVAGSNRAEIESRLQNEFGIRDTGPMLDAILGPES